MYKKGTAIVTPCPSVVVVELNKIMDAKPLKQSLEAPGWLRPLSI